MTGDQKHTDHIATGQRVNRHSSRPECFLFFFHRTFLKTILASRTSGTFGFAPTHKATPSAKPKEPLFCQRSDDNSEYNKTTFAEIETKLDKNSKVKLGMLQNLLTGKTRLM